MHINRILGLGGLITILAGCGTPQDDWFGEYGTMTTGTPVQMQYGTFGTYGTYEQTEIMPDNINMADAKRIAVLLPLSGDNAVAGRTIRTSIETAVLQRGPQNLAVSFYDTAANNTDAINQALAQNPEIIIGPLFAKNAQILRESKPDSLPVLAFTTDATAVGRGVMSMSLMPTNSVEAIVREMKTDGAKNFIIIAPKTTSGEILAGTARNAASIYDMPNVGVFYYTEKDAESIKSTMASASMNAARVAANNRAREILSDILTNETLTAIEKSSLNMQLDKLSKTDTLGNLPYDAVFFLGSGDDTKSLASFLRYYGVGARDVKFYGTAVWDGSDIASDLTLSGAKFATLPPVSESFVNLYERIDGTAPNRLATFGYDAANMAMGMIYSNKSNAAYLLDPSGYMGMDGLFRLKPTGESERALRIVELDGTGTPRTVKNAPTNFMTPIYNIEQRHITPASAMSLETLGVNPMNYIQIPERLRSKYKSKTYGANMTGRTTQPRQENIVIVPSDDGPAIETPDYKPVALETVNRTYIDEIEIEE
ncbi:MAG: penicillin-binding protein activator [Muribaculaceae bacterium]|nr:penicillin-binding protein activator [Muribaculaceae bacterium]